MPLPALDFSSSQLPPLNFGNAEPLPELNFGTPDSDAMKQSIDYQTEPLSGAEMVFGRKEGKLKRGFGDIDYKKEAKDIAVGTYETAKTLGVGAAMFFPALAGQFGTVAGSKIQNSIEKLAKDTPVEKPLELVKQAQKALGFGNPKTPEEQEEMGHKVAEYISSLGGLVEGAKSESGKTSTGLVGKGFDKLHKGLGVVVEPWINKDAFPNAHNFLVSTLEVGVLAGSHATWKTGIKKSREMFDNAKKLKGQERAKAEAEAKSLLDKSTEELEGYLQTPEGIEFKKQKMNEINIRRAKNKVIGKPIKRLAREEESLNAETEYKTKVDEYKGVFEEIPVEEVSLKTKNEFKEINANEINIRRAKQKIQGKPLKKLAREEESLKAESEYNAKQAELKSTFKEIPLEKDRIEMETSLKEKGVIKDFEPYKERTLKDTLKDVNALLGERGEIGNATRTLRQNEAYNRLKKDLTVFKRNAKRVNKTVEEYLIDLKIDPKVAALLGEKTTELKKYAKSVNLEKQDVPREFKEFQAEIAKGSKKKVQTWEELDVLSEKLLSNKIATDAVLKKAQAGEKLNVVEKDAMRKIEVASIDNLKDVLKETPEKFNAEFDKFNKEIWEPLNKAASEAGRDLNAQKKEVSVRAMASAFVKLKRGLNKRELKELTELDRSNPMEVKRFIKRLGNPKLSDYALEYWYNSILSGPPTHVVNTVGNTLWSMYQIPHAMATAIVDMPYSKLTGKPRTRFINELLPMLLGYKSGFKRGRTMAGQVIRTGKIQEFETKWAQEMSSSLGAFDRSPNATVRKIGKFITPPTNALRALDAWANAMAYDAAIGQMARRVSNNKGLKGTERAIFENKFAEKLTDSQHLEAMEQAKHFTFMDNPDPATSTIIKVRNLPVLGPTLKFTVLPFVNTISNLMKRGIELTPGLGLAKEAVSRGMGRGHSTPSVIAKQIEGAVLAAYVFDKMDSGQITGSLPNSKAEREAWYRQGKLPWSIKMGDKWVSYRRIEPFNTVIASAYVAREAMTKETDQKKIDDIFFEVAQGMKNNVIDGSYFQGLQAVMNRHQKTKGSIARFGASFVPYSSFFRSMSRAYEVGTEGNAKAREGNEYQKSFSSVLPWLVDKPPAKLNVWGEDAIIPGGMLRQWLPFKWTDKKSDAVEDEFEKLGFYPGVPDQTVNINGKRVKLDDDIYRKYVQTFGFKAKNKMNAMINTPQYQKSSQRGKNDKLHEKTIKKYMRRIREFERNRAIREQKKRLK